LPWPFSCFAGCSPKLAIVYSQSAPNGELMDYLIGGAATILLFAYLIYALLKPEKF
jgi:K+-transporting ATPase KdpF subunit